MGTCDDQTRGPFIKVDWEFWGIAFNILRHAGAELCQAQAQQGYHVRLPLSKL
jgi:hypothetical protein